MENNNTIYIRSTFLKFERLKNLVDKKFVANTNILLSKISDNFNRLDLLTLDKNCKKIDIFSYERLFQSNLDDVKNEIIKIGENEFIKRCIKYNNNNFYKNYYYKGKSASKTHNNNLKTLLAYISRMSLNPVYGGLYGFYSKVGNNKRDKEVKLTVIEEDNRHISEYVNCKLCLSPSTVAENSIIIAYSYEKNKEKIFKISNKWLAPIIDRAKVDDLVKSRKIDFLPQHIGQQNRSIYYMLWSK